MSVPLILTLLAGGATFIGALLGVLGQKPSNRLLAFSLGFAAGIMLLISLMEMLPAALGEEGMSPVLGYGMFIVGLLGYFALDRILPHAHPQDLIDSPPTHASRNLRRTALLLTLGISLHNFPEGIATYVTASTNLELGFGIALAVALHNIPEGLAVAARFTRPPARVVKRLSGRGSPGWPKFWAACWRGLFSAPWCRRWSWQRLWRRSPGSWWRCRWMS